MTLHIPIRLLLFVVYTAALLGGSAAISYGIIQTVEGPQGEQGPQGERGESADWGLCHQALFDHTFALTKAVEQGVGPELRAELEDILTVYAEHCDDPEFNLQ